MLPRRASLVPLTVAAAALTLSCASTHAPEPDAATPLDAPVSDTPAPLDTPAPHDAPSLDAGPRTDAGPPQRPASWPTLHPVCGARSYDVDDPSTYDSAGELALAYFDAMCARSVRCVSDEIACDPQREAWWTSTTFHDPPDLDGARRCLVSIDTAPCDDGLYFEVCRRDRRHAPDGTSCNGNNDCASGRCVGATSGALCSGACAPLATCTPPCASDAWCDPLLGACVPRRAEGAACGFADEVPCVDGTACLGFGVCTHISFEGEPCGTSPCAFGLVCDPRSVCSRPITVAVGDACDGYHQCPPSSYCWAGLCVARAARGEHCDYETHRCVDGLACNDAEVCAPLVGPGCPCDDGSACPFMLACLPAAGLGATCQPIGVVPTPCTTSTDCDSFECVDGFCYGRVIGESCDDTFEHSCYIGHCLGGVCIPPVPRGGDCTDDHFACMRPESCRAGRCAGDDVSACWPDGP